LLAAVAGADHSWPLWGTAQPGTKGLCRAAHTDDPTEPVALEDKLGHVTEVEARAVHEDVAA
jgi:hypothetical protein